MKLFYCQNKKSVTDNDDLIPRLKILLSKGLSLSSCANILNVSYNVVKRLCQKIKY